MKRQFKLLLLISFFIFFQIEKVRGQTYTAIYDLQFSMQGDSSVVYPWFENAAYSNYSISTYVQESNRKMFAKKFIKGFPFSNHLRTEYQQRILLPYNNAKEATIEFECKGENINLVSIILDAIDMKEEILFSDTLKFVPDSVLSLVSKNIELKNVELLNIRINVEGLIDKDAYIAFSKLDILLGGKTIDTFPIRILQKLSENDNLKYTSIDIENKIELAEINEINDKKIIGFGESIHGNDDIKNLAYQLILQAIESQNCKLVLLELPMEKSFAYNRFIQDKNYTFDSLLLIDQMMNDFLNKLRLFNSDKADDSKVKLLGIDYNSIYSSTQNSAMDIFDFVVQLNQKTNIPEIDQFLLMLMKEDWSQAITFLNDHKKEVQKILTIDEIECISHILNVSKKMGKSGIERFINRDSVMFINAEFLIDKFAAANNNKTIIYGHAAHINPVSTYPAVPCTPFGHYMQITYKEKYSPLLFLIGNGISMAYDERFNRKDNVLSNPPENSVEYWLNTIDENISYIPITSELDKLTLSRFKGSHHILQDFFPFNLYQRYKGIFFIKNTDYNILDMKEISFDKDSDSFIMKIKQRQKKLEEIKKRTQKL